MQLYCNSALFNMQLCLPDTTVKDVMKSQKEINAQNRLSKRTALLQQKHPKQFFFSFAITIGESPY